MKFKTGQIVFFKSNGLFGNLIGSYNLIKYGENLTTHVGIITEVKKNEVLIHEALSDGFVKNYYEKWWLENKIESEEVFIKSSKIKLVNVLKNSEKYLGKGYAWFDIFSIGLALILRFKINFTGANKLICSEAVSRILYDSSDKKINLEKEYDKPYDLITPQDIVYSEYIK